MGPIHVMCTCQHLMEIGTTFCWLLQKIEAAGSGTVPAAVVPWKADGQTAAQRPRAKQSKPASSFPLAPPRSPRCNPWDFSFPVLPFDAAALALCLLCLSSDVAACSCLNGKSSTCKFMTVPQHLPSIEKSIRLAYENEMCVHII